MIFVQVLKDLYEFKNPSPAFKLFALFKLATLCAKHISVQNGNYSEYQH